MAGRHTARHLRKTHRHARPATIAGRARLASAGGPWSEAVTAGPWPRAATAGPWTGATAGHAPPAIAASRARSATAGPWAGRLVGVARFASMLYVFVVVFLALAALIPAVAAGWKPLSVVSGSMQPAIRPGTMVLVQPSEPDRYYAPPSIVAFHDAARPGRLVTHRIDDTGREDTGAVVYTTKGDANRVVDSGAVAHDEVVGAVRMVVPHVGLPQLWMHEGELAKMVPLVLVSLLAVAALLVRGRP